MVTQRAGELETMFVINAFFCFRSKIHFNLSETINHTTCVFRTLRFDSFYSCLFFTLAFPRATQFINIMIQKLIFTNYTINIEEGKNVMEMKA